MSPRISYVPAEEYPSTTGSPEPPDQLCPFRALVVGDTNPWYRCDGQPDRKWCEARYKGVYICDWAKGEIFRRDVGDEMKSDNNNGGSTDYYKFPKGATDLQDLIEHRNMNFSQGNIFKAVYRMDLKNDPEYELNKIIWFAKRERARVRGRNAQS